MFIGKRIQMVLLMYVVNVRQKNDKYTFVILIKFGFKFLGFILLYFIETNSPS